MDKVFRMNRDTLLLLPAFDEEMNIEETLDGLLKEPSVNNMDILVINDGSQDSTLSMLEQYRPRVRVIDQILHLGYGAALQTGYKYAVEHKYSYLIQIDSDGQHDPKNIPRILSKLKGLGTQPGSDPPDIVIGSRFLEGAKSFKVPWLKRFAISFFASVIRILTKCRLTDPTSGLQGLNRRAFSYYAGYSHFDIRYPDLNMILQMIFLGYQVEEVPAIMHERTAGVSMHTGIRQCIQYMAVMIISAFNAVTRYYRVYSKEKKNVKQ